MAMDQKEFEELAINLKERMRAGDVEAMRFLGDLYYQGPSGNDKNIRDALPYWQRAVDNGDFSVANKVAAAYKNGWGCVKNDKEAFRYFKMNADRGDRDALYYIGNAYEYGKMGCPEDEITAIKYLEQAAVKGHAEAMWHAGALGMNHKTKNWTFWICAAHTKGVQEATDYLNYMIKKDFPKDALEWQIEQIKKYGYDPSKHPSSSSSSSSGDGGCYVATCVYGSYDCPQVWTLRRFRDNTLASTWYGRAFIRTYYAVSPTLVKWFGHTDWFKNLWRGKLDALIRKLQSEGVEDTPYSDKIW